jgi:hypothetical protein
MSIAITFRNRSLGSACSPFARPLEFAALGSDIAGKNAQTVDVATTLSSNSPRDQSGHVYIDCDHQLNALIGCDN